MPSKHTVTRRASSYALGISLALLVGCNSNDPAKMVDAARTALAKRDFNTATIEVKNALQKDPNFAPARMLFGEILLQQGDAAGAENELRKAQTAGAKDDELLPQLARAVLQADGPKKLIAEFGSKQLSSPQAQAELATVIGRAMLATSDVNGAAQHFDAALKAQPDNADAMVGQAAVKLAANDIDGALTILGQAIAKSPDNLNAQLLRGDLLSRKGDTQGALAAYTAAEKTHPEDPRPYSRQIALDARLGHIPEATEALKQLKKVAPNVLETVYLDSMLSLQKGDYRAARDASVKVLRVKPDHLQSEIVNATASLKLGDNLEAQAMLDKVIGVTRDWPAPRKLLAQSYLNVRDSERALEALAPLLKTDTTDPETLSLAGQAYLIAGDYERSTQYFQKLAALKPNNAVALTQLGVSRMASGDDVQGLQALETATKLDVTRNQAELAIIANYLRKGEVQKALDEVAALEKKQPDNPQTFIVKGQALLVAKKTPQAREALEHALQLQPSNVGAAAMLANLDLADHKPDVAKKRFEDMIAKDSKNVAAYLQLAQIQLRSSAPTKDVQATLEKAIVADPARIQARAALIQLLLDQGDAKQALNVAQQAQAADQDNPQILALLGATQLAAGDKQQAVVSFSKLSDMQPQNPRALNRLADAQRATGDSAAAERSLRKSLELKPDLAETREQLASLLLNAKRVDDALAVAREAQKLTPDAPFGYMLEADIYTSQQKPQEAILPLQQALKHGRVPRVVTVLWSSYNAVGKPAEAQRVVDDWFKQNPKDIVVRNFLAEQALAAKNYAKAVEQYKTILTVAPEQPIVLNNLAWAANKAKDPKAMEYAENALKAMPNAPVVQETVGTILVEHGQTQRGLDLLHQAAAAAPKLPQIRLGLARALARTGDKDGARKEIAAATDVAPANSPIRKEIEDFAKTL